VAPVLRYQNLSRLNFVLHYIQFNIVNKDIMGLYVFTHGIALIKYSNRITKRLAVKLAAPRN